MSLYKKGLCKECNDNKEKYLIKGLCQYHYKKERAQVYKQRQKAKNPARKKTGEIELFEEIFDQRPRKCFLTDAPLETKEYYKSKGIFHWLFHHVLPKGLYSRFRLDKENIILVEPVVHFDIENMAESDLVKKYPNYSRLINLKETLKSKYNETGI